MAITRDSFDDSKSYQVVLHQQDTPVPDSDLNEAQKITWVARAEGLSSVVSNTRSASNNNVTFPYAEGTDWQPYASGTADIFLRAGVLIIDGHRLVTTSDVSLAGKGLSFAPVGGSNVYGVVVIDVTIEAIDNVTDPNILNDGMLTAQRIRLKTVYRQSESTVSFATAFAGLPAVPAALLAPGRIWKGDVARIVICRYFRAASSTVLTNANLVDHRGPSNADALSQTRFLKALRASNSTGIEGSGSSDGQITWKASSGGLTIGMDNLRNDAGAVQNGLLLRMPGAPDHYISGAFTIADGSAIGFRSNTADPVNALLTKKTLNDSPRANVYASDATVNFTPPILTNEKVVVDTLDNFLLDKSSIVIATRIGRDLLWFNGKVTRGHSTLVAYDDLGGNPSKFNAIVSQDGLGGSAHATQADAVDRALTNITINVGTLANGGTVSLFVKRGFYTASQGLKKYGLADSAFQAFAAAVNSTFEMDGDGYLNTSVTFSNPLGSGRSTSDLGVCQIKASRVVLRNITFGQIENSTHQAAYLFDINAIEVVIENCTFNGAVQIKADNIRIKNCIFTALQTGAYTTFASSTGLRMAGALSLLPQTAAPIVSNWDIQDCLFNVQSVCAGICAIVELNLVSAAVDHQVKFNNCKFEYATFSSTLPSVPAVDIFGDQGTVSLHNCRFMGSLGQNKAGIKLSAQSFPFSGHFEGSPIVEGLMSSQTVTTAYISCVTSRARTSQIIVDGCFFDFSHVAKNSTAHLVMWGAMIVMQTASIIGGVNVTVANITYTNNTHYMSNDNGPGWTAAAGDPQLLIWGFYAAPSIPEGTFTDLQFDNFTISNNKFDLGGQSSSAGVVSRTWRSIAAPDVNNLINNSVSQSTFETTDGSCLIGIVLRNWGYGNISSLNNSIGRFASNITVSGNKVSCRPSSGAITGSQIVIDNSVYPRYSANMFILSNADFWNTTESALGGAVESGGAPFNLATGTTGGAFFAPVVNNNRVEAFYFITSNSAPTSPYSGTQYAGALIALDGVFAGMAAGNFLYGNVNASATGLNMSGVVLRNAVQCNISSNYIKADIGIASGASNANVTGSNLLRGCGSPVSNATKVWPVVSTVVQSNYL